MKNQTAEHLTKSQNGLVRIVLLTALALIAFAANSVLARMALGDATMQAGGYTVVRLLAGAVVLVIILSISRQSSDSGSKGSWAAGMMLFVYALTFSFAYIDLETATGALILFGAVQITMVVVSLLSGHRPSWSEWAGLVLAFSGFVYLMLPGATIPSVSGFVLMTISGIAWGLYTLKGRGSKNPLADTTYNFLRTVPLVLVVLALTWAESTYTMRGVLLAALSGGIASGLGYTIWYAALGGLSATQAAVLQLLVPVIAAVGGIIFVSESITMRLTIAAILILTGILLVILSRKPG